ncbi:MAG TPA: hypothetical protein P5186_03955 [Candidatus Paceibacterota bacterium]|nr:hypothetical protein [Verrucomicrobiota bacterium]HRY47182.1 hypothetical protein [Candidatus Paceibacterota bacterium]HSA02931.1 hypothetical protein [Candidatus Paceibacterota bacterium]
MAPVVIKVVTGDRSILELRERLAHDLGEAGIVYSPHPVIPPNARMAVPPPDHLLVSLRSKGDVGFLLRAVTAHLQGGENRRVALEGASGQLKLTSSELPSEKNLLRELFSDGR